LDKLLPFDYELEKQPRNHYDDGRLDYREPTTRHAE